MLQSLVHILAGLTQIGANITSNQRKYLEWRTSPAGQRYFAAEDNNEFYRALERGDTEVIDIGIHAKQQRIDALRKYLGLMSLCVLLCSGCAQMTGSVIPTRDMPSAVIESLTEEERSYVVKDMTVKVAGDVKTLEGQYHVVSPDFIRVFRRNQDDTLVALERLMKYQKGAPYALGSSILVALIIGFLVGSRKR
jgi:hypothetical protein